MYSQVNKNSKTKLMTIYISSMRTQYKYPRYATFIFPSCNTISVFYHPIIEHYYCNTSYKGLSVLYEPSLKQSLEQVQMF